MENMQNVTDALNALGVNDLPRLREGGGQIPLHGVQDRALLREGLPEGSVARAQEGVPQDRAGAGPAP